MASTSEHLQIVKCDRSDYDGALRLKLRKGFEAGQRMICFFYSTAGGCVLLIDPCVVIFCVMERPIIQLFIKSLLLTLFIVFTECEKVTDLMKSIARNKNSV